MRCLSPITIHAPKRKGHYAQVNVPCGKCYNCLVNKRSQMAYRLFNEAEHSQSNYFITLTYDDEHLFFKDNYAVLEKEEIQRWLKNLVQKCRDSYSVVVKYYLVGEYGFRHGRPHYHLHLFNLPPTIDIYNFCVSIWNKGGFYVGNTCGASAMYTTKHNLLKMLPSELNPNFVVEQIVPPFVFMSKGLGKHVLDDFVKKFPGGSLVTIPKYLSADGKKIPMPRYLRDKFNSYINNGIKVNLLYDHYRSEKNRKLYFDRKDINYDRDIPYMLSLIHI